VIILKITNLKLRGTDHGHSPFEGIILTSCADKSHGRTIDITEDLLYENIDGIVLEGNWEERPLELSKIVAMAKEKNLKLAIVKEED
jgi:hypothetical protein